MKGRRGLAGAIGLGALVLLALYAGLRPTGAGDLRTGVHEREDEPARPGAGGGPTATLAEETLERFERFRSGKTGSRLALGETELSSVARYALPGIFPPGVMEPSVDLEGGEVRVAARVDLGAFPALEKLHLVVGLLPDTVLVEMHGWLEPLDRRRLSFAVDRIEVAGVPLPRRLVPEILAALGRGAMEGLAPNALGVPRPGGLLSIVVLRDSLVLTGEHGGAPARRVVEEESS